MFRPPPIFHFFFLIRRRALVGTILLPSTNDYSVGLESTACARQICLDSTKLVVGIDRARGAAHGNRSGSGSDLQRASGSSAFSRAAQTVAMYDMRSVGGRAWRGLSRGSGLTDGLGGGATCPASFGVSSTPIWEAPVPGFASTISCVGRSIVVGTCSGLTLVWSSTLPPVTASAPHYAMRPAPSIRPAASALGEEVSTATLASRQGWGREECGMWGEHICSSPSQISAAAVFGGPDTGRVRCASECFHLLSCSHDAVGRSKGLPA